MKTLKIIYHCFNFTLLSPFETFYKFYLKTPVDIRRLCGLYWGQGGDYMELRQELLQVRTLILSQRMEQSLAVLQMSEAELMECAAAECEKNPLLDMEYRQTPYSYEYHGGRTYRDDQELDYLQNIPKTACSMGEYLIDQVQELPLSHEIAQICCVFANSLDERGYLDPSVFPLLQSSGIADTKICEAYTAFLTLEPVGIGALCLEHCLWLQLTTAQKSCYASCMPHLHLLCSGGHKQFCEKAKLSAKELQGLLAVLATLDPKPGAGLGQPQTVSYIIPDLAIVADEGGFTANLFEEKAWKLTVNTTYRTNLQGEVDEATIQYLVKKQTQAQYLIEAIQKREKTLLEIGSAIAHGQQDFFQYGTIALRPYTLADIALYTGLHPSTVSRGIKNKYLQCKWGVFSLRYFLAQGTGALSKTQICVHIQKLIQQENPANPYSDEQLADLLKQQGIPVARRTISKYRGAANIPSASIRKLKQPIQEGL